MKQHTQYYNDKSSILRFTQNQPVQQIKVIPVVIDKVSERPIKKQKLNDK
jgi:hypothetical protein